MATSGFTCVLTADDRHILFLLGKSLPQSLRRAGSWVIVDHAHSGLAVDLSAEFSAFSVLVDISTTTDSFSMEVFKDGLTVRKLSYIRDHGWGSNVGDVLPIENAAAIKAWRRKRMLLGEDGYDVLRDLTGCDVAHAEPLKPPPAPKKPAAARKPVNFVIVPDGDLGFRLKTRHAWTPQNPPYEDRRTCVEG